MNKLKFVVYFPILNLYFGKGRYISYTSFDRAEIFESKWQAIEAGSATKKVFIVQEIYVP